MGEFFKTLRDPLLEKQRETDAKQDQMLEQLQKGQEAIERTLDFREMPQFMGPVKSPIESRTNYLCC